MSDRRDMNVRSAIRLESVMHFVDPEFVDAKVVQK